MKHMKTPRFFAVKSEWVGGKLGAFEPIIAGALKLLECVWASYVSEKRICVGIYDLDVGLEEWVDYLIIEGIHQHLLKSRIVEPRYIGYVSWPKVILI